MKNIKKTKRFWAYYILGLASIVLALLLAPFWSKVWAGCPWKDFGFKVVSYVIAALIGIYLFGFVFKKIKQSRGTIRLLTIIEFVLLALVALGLIFSQLNVLNITNPSIILGIAFYTRGVIEVFRAYYHQKSSTIKYPVSWLVVSIIFVTIGVYFMVSNVITINLILYILVCALVLFGLFSIFCGYVSKPEATVKKEETEIVEETKKEKTKKEKKAKK